jgi:uncharacterized protein YndB with AHSA1/START domain
MTTPDIPHRFEYEVEVPGTPEAVWHAIATAEGISSWMMPTELDERIGGEVTFHMGPDISSKGHVTAFEPARRIEYAEDWASLMGHPGADVTPLVTEFLVEARSGGTCVVRVVTSAFGTGADWENEFFEEMNGGWAPMLENLRLYLAHFPGQNATTLSGGSEFAGVSPEAAVDAARASLGITGEIGERVSARGIHGRVERSLDRHFLVRVESPVTGLLSFQSGSSEKGSGVHLTGYLFSDDAAGYVEREQPAWQAWLDEVASGASVDATTG